MYVQRLYNTHLHSLRVRPGFDGGQELSSARTLQERNMFTCFMLCIQFDQFSCVMIIIIIIMCLFLFYLKIPPHHEPDLTFLLLRLRHSDCQTPTHTHTTITTPSCPACVSHTLRLTLTAWFCCQLQNVRTALRSLGTRLGLTRLRLDWGGRGRMAFFSPS